MAELILGPVLRYVGETEATVWVETDSSCEVDVLGHRERTFCVEGHHYALVVVDGLEPGGTYEYEVLLDGVRRWPHADSGFPPSSIRTIDPDRPLKIVFGSCRVAVPHEPPWTLTRDEDPDHGREIDALYALAIRMRETSRDEWPLVLLSIGDQVYVDEEAPQTREFIRSRRDVTRPPGEEVADFEEYTRLYWESWGTPAIRWLLSTVSVAMIFDDHDVHDDWNTSQRWVEEVEAKPWWRRRINSALASYWIYQHVGNFSPGMLAESELLQRLEQADDGGELMREFAEWADNSNDGSRWSYSRDLGRTRLVVFDSREGRVLDRRAAGLGERVRRALDLEHWAAFGDSFQRMSGLLADIAAGRRGRAPATVITLGGDVHHAYLAEVAFRRSEGAASAVYQAVCSPFRNALDARERRVIDTATRKGTGAVVRRLARLAGAANPRLRWRLVQDPTFDNQFATLEIDGRKATLRIQRIVPGDWRNPRIETSLERRLA